ncbi:MAG: 4-diphosphocytidyl-2C-methyl-D-erythritol synthase [Sphingomonadales bacterium]|nr:MAG: 4-diphosphocytidyl-2C-methyl-D-erythritol synthase [Sphingomonadales bacterium]
MNGAIPAIILAGSRPGPDPLLTGTGVSTKALLPIAGQAMLVHVVRALRASPDVGAITILAQNSAELAAEPGLAGMVGEFLREAADSDVAVAMVERDTLLARYPESRRTWLKFRGGWWSGANMFRLRGRRVLPLLDFWGRIERDRKKGLKVVAAFGPWLLIGALLRLFTIQQGVARAGLRFGLKAKVVPMSEPEACIDADKPVDIELIEAIFAARRQDAIGQPL